MPRANEETKRREVDELDDVRTELIQRRDVLRGRLDAAKARWEQVGGPGRQSPLAFAAPADAEASQQSSEAAAAVPVEAADYRSATSALDVKHSSLTADVEALRKEHAALRRDIAKIDAAIADELADAARANDALTSSVTSGSNIVDRPAPMNYAFAAIAAIALYFIAPRFLLASYLYVAGAHTSGTVSYAPHAGRGAAIDYVTNGVARSISLHLFERDGVTGDRVDVMYDPRKPSRAISLNGLSYFFYLCATAFCLFVFRGGVRRQFNKSVGIGLAEGVAHAARNGARGRRP